MKKDKGKKNKCKKCTFFKKSEEWNSKTRKHDTRKMGYCYFDPPKLMQNIVPSVVRERGYNGLSQFMEECQFRPMVEETDYCSKYKG